eukprot:546863_1
MGACESRQQEIEKAFKTLNKHPKKGRRKKKNDSNPFALSPTNSSSRSSSKTSSRASSSSSGVQSDDGTHQQDEKFEILESIAESVVESVAEMDISVNDMDGIIDDSENSVHDSDNMDGIIVNDLGIAEIITPGNDEENQEQSNDTDEFKVDVDEVVAGIEESDRKNRMDSHSRNFQHKCLRNCCKEYGQAQQHFKKQITKDQNDAYSRWIQFSLLPGYKPCPANRKLAHKLCVEYFEVEGKKRLSNQLKSKNIINTDDELDIMDTHALHWFEVCCMLHEEVMEDFYMHCINVPNDEKLKLNPLFKIIQMFPPRKARNIYVQRNRLKMKEKEAQNEVHIEEKTKEKQPTIFSLWGVNRNNSNNNNVNTKRKIMIKFEDKKYEIEYGRADTLLDVKNTFFDHYIEEELNKKEYVFGCLEYGVFQINECIKLWSVSHYKTIECSKRLLKLIVHEFNDENTSVGNRTIWISLLSDLDELTKHLQRGKKGFRYKGQELYAEINPNAQDEDIEIETDLSLTEQGIMDNTKIYFFTD